MRLTAPFALHPCDLSLYNKESNHYIVNVIFVVVVVATIMDKKQSANKATLNIAKRNDSSEEEYITPATAVVTAVAATGVVDSVVVGTSKTSKQQQQQQQPPQPMEEAMTTAAIDQAKSNNDNNKNSTFIPKQNPSNLLDNGDQSNHHHNANANTEARSTPLAFDTTATSFKQYDSSDIDKNDNDNHYNNEDGDDDHTVDIDIDDHDDKDDDKDDQGKNSDAPSGSVYDDDHDNDNDDDDNDDDKTAGSDDEEGIEERVIPGVNTMDVLLGRPGRHTRNHKGNQLYWECVLKQVSVFHMVVNNKSAQYDLAKNVIYHVEKENHGKFMESNDKGQWVQASDETVLNKVRRSIKEKWERSQLDRKNCSESRLKSSESWEHSKTSKQQHQSSRSTTTSSSSSNNSSRTTTSNININNSNSSDVVVKSNDVILYFGFSNHQGNKAYWKYVLKEAVPYYGPVKDDKDAQIHLAKKVVDYVVQKNGGRFLQPIARRRWQVVPEDTVLLKVRRAIKERWERSHKGSTITNPPGKKDPPTTTTISTTTMEIELQPMDVFLGRPVSGHRSHEGNELYWEFLCQQVPKYGKAAADRDFQFELAKKVLDYVQRTNGGRFLEINDKGTWCIVPETTALQKIRRAMKEKWERSLISGSTQITANASNSSSSSTNNIPKQPEDLEEQPDLTPMDVLIGRPNGSRQGNQLYWDCVVEHLPQFANIVNDKDAQLELAQKVVDRVQKVHGGRFMEFNESKGLWMVSHDSTVLQKVRRAIKEKWEREAKKGLFLALDKKKKHKIKENNTEGNRPKRSKIIPKKTTTTTATTDEQMIQLTHDIVDILKV
jgi:hypothetical protein